MLIEIKDEEIHDIRDAFAKFDKDGSGSITGNELGNIYKSLGHVFTEQKLNKMMNFIDLNKDGYITFHEFMSLYKRYVLFKDTKVKLREAFKICDCDGNGFVTFDELKTIMKQVGEHLTDDQITSMLKEFDFDDDDKINFEEFIQLMKNQ